jgi:undecaprenyl-diphosphatase
MAEWLRRLRWIVLAAALLAICFVWADRAVYDLLHANYNHLTRPIPRLLAMPTRLLRSAEDWGENFFIAVVLVAMWRLDPTRRSRVLCLVLAAFATTAGVELIKRSTGRDRPDVALGATVFHGASHSADFLGDSHSFPSGHTASAGSYSGSLAAFYPPLRPACIAMVAMCGASRMWKERHFLSDCLLGGLLGWWIATSLPRNRRLQPLWGWFDRRFSKPESIPLMVQRAA